MRLSGLAEKILATKGIGGFPLAWLGQVQTIIPVFPPNSEFTLETEPPGGNYACIEIFFQVSPAMMPGVVNIERFLSGVPKLAPVISTAVMAEPQDTWEVIMGANKMRALYRNVSGLNQYMETISAYLVVATPRELDEVYGLAHIWGVR